MSEVTFTEKEFLAQIVEFRRMFGTKDFWALPVDKREVAVSALGHAYLFLDGTLPQEVIERCAGIYSATVEEYNRRGFMMLRLQLA